SHTSKTFAFVLRLTKTRVEFGSRSGDGQVRSIVSELSHCGEGSGSFLAMDHSVIPPSSHDARSTVPSVEISRLRTFRPSLENASSSDFEARSHTRTRQRSLSVTAMARLRRSWLTADSSRSPVTRIFATSSNAGNR